MSDGSLEQAIGAVLQDPQQLQKIFALAQSLGLSPPEAPAAPPPPEPPKPAAAATSAEQAPEDRGSALRTLCAGGQARPPTGKPSQRAQTIFKARATGKSGPRDAGSENLASCRCSTARSGPERPVMGGDCMYNRYTPSPDGTFQRTVVPDAPSGKNSAPAPPPEPPRHGAPHAKAAGNSSEAACAEAALRKSSRTAKAAASASACRLSPRPAAEKTSAPGGSTQAICWCC